jgi:hypothetical protein
MLHIIHTAKTPDLGSCTLQAPLQITHNSTPTAQLQVLSLRKHPRQTVSNNRTSPNRVQPRADGAAM